MEKRLIDAYDHMTMPEECSCRIENRLQAELENRKPGQYTKVISPVEPRRNGWAAAAACVMLVLVVSGTAILFLNKLRPTIDNPSELYIDVATEEVAQSTTPKDFYYSVTSLSAEEVENFAAVVRYLILTENWKALAGKIQYPITIEQKVIEDEDAFVAFMKDISLGSHFRLSMKYESCSAMWFDDTGIIMGDGQICISEAQRKQLKITSICRLTESAEDMVHFTICRYPDGTTAIHEYRGYEETVIIPGILGNSVITQIGTQYPVIANGNVVKTVKISDFVTVVVDRAFAECPALEAVFFEGDAPSEAEDVFEGTENVTVYYRKGSKGWGDTWCGRRTQAYDGGYLSLGTVTVEDRVPEAFEAVLSGEPVVFYGNGGEMTVQKYCAALWGENMTASRFTVVDMDDDGICELVFAVQDADGVTGGYLVLRAEETKICGYTLRGRDLRKNGTIYSFTAKKNARLQFRDSLAYTVESVDFSQQDKPLAQWHIYPCQGAALVLESYRYASETGFSTHPGSPYYYLGTLLSGEAEWSAVQPWLAQQSVYVEGPGGFYAFDPDAPGCLMYGSFIGTGEQKQLTTLGYYICDETGEYRAVAYDLDTSKPVYTVNPPPDDRGRVVESVEAMQDYFGIDFYGSEIPRDTQQIAELLDQFVHWYAIHDTKGMQACMAETAGDLSSYPFMGNVSILTYGVLPAEAVNVGESWHTSVELMESGETKTYYHLSVVLAKQQDGWKVHAYSLEKQ